MKKKSFFLLSFLLVFSIMLFACNAITLSGGPDANDTIYGNGGSAVVKGEYIYFANAFIDYNSLGINDNKYDDKSPQKIYGIYRAKLNNVGGVDLNEDGNREGAELLTYNVGGFAYSNIYIFGDYLYYATPYSQPVSSGSETKGLVRIDRVKLNGTGHEELYKISSYGADASFDLVEIDGSVYIVALDTNDKLVTVKVQGGNKQETINLDAITSFKVYEQNNIIIGNSINDFNKYVYYTKRLTTSAGQEGDYVLCRRALSGGSESQLYRSADEILVNCVKDGRVYFTVGGVLKSFDKTNINSQNPKVYTDLPVVSGDSGAYLSDYLVIDGSVGGNLDRGIVGVFYDGANYSLNYYNGSELKPLNLDIEDSTKSITLLATQGNEFYYQIADDTSLYKCVLNFDISTVTNSYTITDASSSVIAQEFSSDVNGNDMLDFDQDRIYVYYQGTGDGKPYLNMYMINTNYAYLDEETGNYICRYIGVKQE